MIDAETELPFFKNGEKVWLVHPSAKQKEIAGLPGVVVKSDPEHRDPKSREICCDEGEMPVKVVFQGRGICKAVWISNTQLVRRV